MVIIYCLVMLFIILGGIKDHLFKADLMVVLGTKVELDGTPSSGLEARLNKAISVYQQGYAPVILVSGGTGKEGYDEASVMAQYLVDHGVPKQVIIQDNQGVNTRATAKNSAEYMHKNHMESVIIITQYFHIPRTKLAFQAVGIDKIGQGSPNYTSWRDFFSVPREMLGYPAYWLNLK
ncbi:YdcF family protein [Commensalibacter nepenthis]|uniref:YdcF family protein n=1 Tax=Commensalibacter nepenthis TaxID=3043872 RepID=A0ABT6Q5W5_9PROT|nr:YdcF family protein [Commensalibacter sp. TBRC 10068]MDI2112184.1 YdcF family protein [Commensalibacter sp. TBRC 10068]